MAAGRAGARARAGGRAGRAPGRGSGGGGAPARRSRAQRTRLGPRGNCCSPREPGGDADAPVPRSARGNRKGEGSGRRSPGEEPPPPLFLSQHVPDPAAPPPARRGPRAAAAGAALTRRRAGGALRAWGPGGRERERPLRSERGVPSPRGHRASRP